jgi:predicted RNase H-like HicB family nuclease
VGKGRNQGERSRNEVKGVRVEGKEEGFHLMKVQEIIFMVEEDPEGGYDARALGQSIFTQGDTVEELRKNIKAALECHFDKKEDIPNIIRLHIVREEMFAYA